MGHYANPAMRSLAFAAAGASVSLVGVCALVVTRGNLPAYMGLGGVAAVLVPVVALALLSCAAVWLAVRGRRALATFPALLAIPGHIALAALFARALIDDGGTWRTQGIPLLAFTCALLVSTSLAVWRRRAAV